MAAECWSCSYPAPGLRVVSGGKPLGVCDDCSSLTCEQHGAVDASVNKFRCAACYPLVALQTTAGSPAPPGSGGGPPLTQPVYSEDTLALHVPDLVAASRAHADEVRSVSPLAVFVGDLRWRRLTGQPLRASTDLAASLIGISLYAAGLRPGDIPRFQPGEEGPLLRRNPLIAGLLHAQRLGSLFEAFEAARYGELWEPDRIPEFDAELNAQLNAELRTLSSLPPPPRRVEYRTADNGGEDDRYV